MLHSFVRFLRRHLLGDRAGVGEELISALVRTSRIDVSTLEKLKAELTLKGSGYFNAAVLLEMLPFHVALHSEPIEPLFKTMTSGAFERDYVEAFIDGSLEACSAHGSPREEASRVLAQIDDIERRTREEGSEEADPLETMAKGYLVAIGAFDPDDLLARVFAVGAIGARVVENTKMFRALIDTGRFV